MGLAKEVEKSVTWFLCHNCFRTLKRSEAPQRGPPNKIQTVKNKQPPNVIGVINFQFNSSFFYIEWIIC